ncbi:hypothetical protein DM02DRAFT_8240 [Periconia macrospinosa]|uniref:Uncharacterized protein n=1 Tax=Periconia macrospinosa TaxID=97972 RepID=A0A2V1EDF9_9PLEO|nr:hypothetical protein DM02DRAFT_8240 [Periconia macrospinosa]
MIIARSEVMANLYQILVMIPFSLAGGKCNFYTLDSMLQSPTFNKAVPSESAQEGLMRAERAPCEEEIPWLVHSLTHELETHVEAMRGIMPRPRVQPDRTTTQDPQTTNTRSCKRRRLDDSVPAPGGGLSNTTIPQANSPSSMTDPLPPFLPYSGLSDSNIPRSYLGRCYLFYRRRHIP